MSGRRIDDMLLVAYLDGELAPEAARQVEQLAREDAEVAQRLASFRWSGEMLRLALAEDHFEPRDGRLAGLVSTLSAASRPRPWQRTMPALAASIAGLLAGAGVMFAMLRPPPSPDPVVSVLQEVGEYHAVFARETEHLVEVPAARKEHIEAWLGERVGLNLAVPDLTAAGLRFEGGRMLVVEGEPVAQLLYTAQDGRRVALCVSRLAQKGSGRPTAVVEDGIRLVGKPQGGHVFIVAGNENDPMLDWLAERLPGLLVRAET